MMPTVFGLSENFWLIQEIENAALSWDESAVPWLSMANLPWSPRLEVVSLAMTTIEPAEKLNNWWQIGVSRNMVRYVIENLVRTDWDGGKIYKGAAGNALCQKRLSAWTVIWRKACSIIRYLIDPDVISLGGSIRIPTSSKVSRRLSVTLSIPTKNTRSHQLSKLAPIVRSQSLWCPCQLAAGGKSMVILQDLVPNKSKHWSCLKAIR